MLTAEELDGNMLTDEELDGVVIHKYFRKGSSATMVVVYKRPDEGGVHLRAPLVGVALKLTSGEHRQYEEMPEDRCRKLRKRLQDIRKD